MERRGLSSRSYELRIDLPLEELFAWASDVGRLDELTPRWFVLEPIAPPPLRLYVGAEVEYRFRWRRFRLRWRSRITDWKPPHYFAYEQVRGPFRDFRHEHFFRGEGGGTWMEDRVIYRTWGGRWLDRWIVGPDLDRVFAYRESALRVAADAVRGSGALAADGQRVAGRRQPGQERSDVQLEALPPAKRMP